MLLRPSTLQPLPSFDMGPLFRGLEYDLASYAIGLLAPIPVLFADLSLIWASLPRKESAALLPPASLNAEGMSGQGL
jgi:hypothetical protein